MGQFPFAFRESYEDPKYRSINLNVNGTIKTFEENVDDKTKSDITKALINSFENALKILSSEGVGYQALQSKISFIISKVVLNLSDSGFHVTDVSFDQLGPDESTKARLAKLAEVEMFASDPALLAQKMAEGEKAHMEAVSASAAPTPVAAAKFCRNCGSPAGAGKFCIFCGSLLNP